MSVPEPELLKLFGDVADYKIVWENDTGGATILQEPRSITQDLFSDLTSIHLYSRYTD